MRAMLILLLFVFCNSFPNLVYVTKDCIEKLYNVEDDPEMLYSIQNELLKYQTDEFYARVEKISPVLKANLKKCIDDVYDKYLKEFRELMRTIPDHFE